MGRSAVALASWLRNFMLRECIPANFQSFVPPLAITCRSPICASLLDVTIAARSSIRKSPRWQIVIRNPTNACGQVAIDLHEFLDGLPSLGIIDEETNRQRS